MFSLLALTLVLSADPFPYEKEEAELSEEIRVEELKAHVYRLASPEFMGRSGPGAARAAKHIAGMFEKLKLKPAFGDSYLQPIPWQLKNADNKEPSIIGQNVAAILPGSDPQLKDEWILLTAHFDHLGKRGAKLYAGADDDASGVAMLLEVAERFALQKHKPKRTIVFVAFDQEETGLLGSTHFAAHTPLELKNLKAFLTADMIGRSMAGVMDEYVFVLGSENSKQMRELLEENPPKPGLKAGRVGTDIIGTRSDYGPFRDRKVPFLFFSTGMHQDYHQPSDTPEKIDFEKLKRISDGIHDLTEKLADDETTPTWAVDGLPPDVDEVRTIHALLSRILDKPKIFPLSDNQRIMVKGTAEKLQAILDRGKVTPTERTALLWTARFLMGALFQQ
ncbi:MAG TPA: M20/M25/M40 family metallo-hydrolase [Gemmataceae bacterium]|nr:M20/M25/M40 family metallo-hydrolase [Gemmataceae bacterium]